jgi:hypothetical protein
MAIVPWRRKKKKEKEKEIDYSGNSSVQGSR